MLLVYKLGCHWHVNGKLPYGFFKVELINREQVQATRLVLVIHKSVHLNLNKIFTLATNILIKYIITVMKSGYISFNQSSIS